jgi:hypothetical protein
LASDEDKRDANEKNRDDVITPNDRNDDPEEEDIEGRAC